MSKKKLYANKRNTNNDVPIITLLPILFVIVIIPLIVRAVQVNTNLSEYIWYSKATTTIDVFLKIKSILFLVTCSVMAVLVIYLILSIFSKNNARVTNYTHKPNYIDSVTPKKMLTVFLNEKCFIPLVLYMLLILFSTFASEHRNIALNGSVEQFESMWVLLGYGLIVYYTYLFLNSIQQLRIVIQALLIPITLITVIGLSQLTRHDFFQTSFGKLLISKNDLSFRFAPGHVYATLYNPNYVGLFVTLVIPILIILVIYTKGILKKILYGILILGLLVCAYGANSSSGTFGVIAASLALGILIALLYRSKLIKYTKKIGIGIISVALILVGVNFLFNNPIGKKIQQVTNFFTDTSSNPISNLSRITTEDEQVDLVYKEEKLSIQFYNDKGQYTFEFRDSSDNELEQQLSADNSIITLTDERFIDYQFYITQYDNIICFAVNVEGSVWYFTNQTDGTYYYCNNYGKLLKIDQNQEFKAFWNIGSGRGYIWDKTVPILKAHPVLGTGPDTYALYFPNTDYLNLYHTGFSNEIITKPHSLYLQIAAQTGIPSLIAFLVFYAMYAISSIKLYMRHNFKKYEVRIGIAILAGTFGYLVTSIANDSTIAVAPLFWTLIGVGLAINRMIKKNV